MNGKSYLIITILFVWAALTIPIASHKLTHVYQGKQVNANMTEVCLTGWSSTETRFGWVKSFQDVTKEELKQMENQALIPEIIACVIILACFLFVTHCELKK